MQRLQSNPNFKFCEGDVKDEIVSEAKLIFNLACPASPKHYQADPVNTLLTSVLGANNLAKLAIKNNALLFHCSTSEVYGDPTISPQKETYWGNVNPIGTRSCYDEGKRAAETLLLDYHRHHGLKLKLVRIFNTYGPNMAEADGRVVSNFICQALRGDNLTIYGNGLQTRSFCYVDDLIAAFMAVLKNSGNATGPFNIGNPAEFTIKQLANLVVELSDTNPKIVFKDLPEDDPKQRRPDITFVTETTGWTPKTDLRTGIQRTIEYFKQNIV